MHFKGFLIMGKLCQLCTVISVFLFALFQGCASIKPTITEPASSSSRGEVQQTIVKTDTLVFNPMELEDDGILIPRWSEGTTLIEPEISTQPIETVPALQAPLVTDEEEQWEEAIKPGYRVQVFASKGVDAARQVEAEVMELFPGIVYLSYDPPNYKVRIGNCSTRKEANEIRREAIRYGYKDAWVVRDNIIVRVKVQ